MVTVKDYAGILLSHDWSDLPSFGTCEMIRGSRGMAELCIWMAFILAYDVELL